MYNTFGTFLRQLRREQHMTQNHVARHLGISRQAYAYYEQSDAIPGLEIIIKLSELFHVPVQAFSCYFPENSLLLKETNSYHATPCPRQEHEDFLAFFSTQENMKKYHHLNRAEKKMLFAFQKLSSDEQNEVLQFAQFKTALHSPDTSSK